jgi:hypothetical protein
LFLKNGAGGVHDQLCQNCPVESTEESSASLTLEKKKP